MDSGISYVFTALLSSSEILSAAALLLLMFVCVAEMYCIAPVGQKLAHFASPLQRSHLMGISYPSFSDRAPKGHTTRHILQPIHSLGSIRMAPVSEFLLSALVGQTSVHGGFSQCWHTMGTLMPSQYQLTTPILASAGLQAPPCAKEHTGSQILHPVHFSGSTTRIFRCIELQPSCFSSSIDGSIQVIRYVLQADLLEFLSRGQARLPVPAPQRVVFVQHPI